ncbi:60S ribosomal protein L28-like isoform X1 [Strongylocentrotus purpuratus]|uniref:Large ribosomal subunit protein eL28 n=2 Tax=Strongylocentrotus purpuratus TaxID=7668 RepID=A0A7M7T4V5_STRPU|nr:60S ribosomal protein L28-like isoform X1 [Strongylocentrotus purpuratus]
MRVLLFLFPSPTYRSKDKMASADLQWLIIRNNSCFLKHGGGVTMSTEPNNLKNRNSFKYNGLIHKKAVGVEAAADGKGVVLVTKKIKGTMNKPAKTFNRVEMKKDSRRTLTAIRRTLKKGYRKDLKMAALRRASAIIRSQKPITSVQKKRPTKARRT